MDGYLNNLKQFKTHNKKIQKLNKNADNKTEQGEREDTHTWIYGDNTEKGMSKGNQINGRRRENRAISIKSSNI